MQLNAFLKYHRTRISPQATALGPYRRLPSRRGRIVSQEELAEFIGVSRPWYATLESDPAVRPSTALLERIASALSQRRRPDMKPPAHAAGVFAF